jgi:hypothetical protein
MIVTLIKDLPRGAKKPIPAGRTIDVSEPDANRLLAEGFIAELGQTPAQKKAALRALEKAVKTAGKRTLPMPEPPPDPG